MDAEPAPGPPTPGWLRPRTESEGLARYVTTLRERRWLIFATTAAAFLVALVYALTAPKQYEADASLLVTPVSSSDPATVGLGLITESTDPTQTTSTAAKLVSTQSVAAIAARRLRLSQPAESLLDDVVVEPIAQSNLVAVRATRGSAVEAARLANAFAQAAVDQRTEELHRAIDAQLPRLRASASSGTTTTPDAASGGTSLSARIAALQSLASGPDPTLRVATLATPPASPSSPKPKLALAAGLLGGLLLGVGFAFASQTLDPRLRREDQIRELFRLPLLARVPRVARPGQAGAPLAPGQLPRAATEAFRTLRATLAATSGDHVQSVLITSSTAGEGKTTTAFNFAYVLAQSGHSVILIEGDLRRPSIVENLSVRPMLGIGAVLIGAAQLEDVLFRTDEYGPNLSFLLAERSAHGLSDRLSLPAARRLINDAEDIADYVIIDSPPLTEVVDALPLAQHVDAVVIVARQGTSRLNRLRDLGDMLAQGNVTPAGVVLVGAERVPDSPYYADAAPPRAEDVDPDLSR